MTETTIDSKGRILIPAAIRKKLRLVEGSRLSVTISEVDNSIIIKPSIDPERFRALAEGFLKQGSPVKVADPLQLKKIWTSSSTDRN